VVALFTYGAVVAETDRHFWISRSSLGDIELSACRAINRHLWGALTAPKDSEVPSEWSTGCAITNGGPALFLSR